METRRISLLPVASTLSVNCTIKYVGPGYASLQLHQRLMCEVISYRNLQRQNKKGQRNGIAELMKYHL